MAEISDNRSLLLFRVGPVLCCAPSLPITTIIHPPELTRPPGSDSARPGIFKYSDNIVSSLDLRYKFGVDQQHWTDPCRVIITQIDPGSVGFWVDEIQEVIVAPSSGWDALPPLLPRGIFTQTLLLNKKIYLYSEFDKLFKIPTSGYLRIYIEHLLAAEKLEQSQQDSKSTAFTTGAIGAPISDPIKTQSRAQENITNKKTTLHSRSTSTEIHSEERAQSPGDVLPRSLVNQHSKTDVEKSTSATKEVSPPGTDIKKTPEKTTTIPTAPAHSTLNDVKKSQPEKSDTLVQNRKYSLTSSKHNNTIQTATKSSKLNEQVELKTHTGGFTKTNRLSSESNAEPKITSSTRPDESPVLHEKTITSVKSINQQSRSLPTRHGQKDNKSADSLSTDSTSTNRPLNKTTSNTGDNKNQSSGSGIAIVLILILVSIPALVWYLSSTDEINPQNEKHVVKKINPEKGKENGISNINQSDVTQSTALDQPGSTDELEVTHDSYQDILNDDEKDNSFNISTHENKTEVSDITPETLNEHKNEPSETEDPTETKSSDTTVAKLAITPTEPIEPIEPADPSILIETKSTTTTSGQDKEKTDYHADIQSDDDGITIILEVPEDTSVFRSETSTDVNTLTKPEKDSSLLATKTTKAPTSNEVDIELRVETNHETSDSSATDTAAKHGASDSTNPVLTAGKTSTSTITRTEIIHIVVKGDTLWHIAIRYVNNPYKYPELARLSNIKNPDLIYPGNRVRIIKKIRRPR